MANWTARAEYLYVDLGERPYALTGTNHGIESSVLRLRRELPLLTGSDGSPKCLEFLARNSARDAHHMFRHATNKFKAASSKFQEPSTL